MIQKIEVDKEGNVDIYLRLLGDLGLDESVLIEENETVLNCDDQHKDVTERLIQINPALAKEARKVLDTNKSERHIREGWLRGKNICTKCYLNRSESSLQIESEPNILERYSKVRISSKR